MEALDHYQMAPAYLQPFNPWHNCTAILPRENGSWYPDGFQHKKSQLNIW